MSDPADAPLIAVSRAFGLPGAVEFHRDDRLDFLAFGPAAGPPFVRVGVAPELVIACRLDRLRDVWKALHGRPRKRLSRPRPATDAPLPDGLALLGEAVRALLPTHRDLAGRIDDYLALAGRRVAAAPEAAAEADDEFPF